MRNLRELVIAERIEHKRRALQDAHLDGMLGFIAWGIARNQHYSLPEDLALEIIQATKTHEMEYDFERRNCDDFAEELRYRVRKLSGWRGIGIICDYGGYHWYNCALLHDAEGQPYFQLVEPQTGQFVNPGESRGGDSGCYDLQNGWLML